MSEPSDTADAAAYFASSLNTQYYAAGAPGATSEDTLLALDQTTAKLAQMEVAKPAAVAPPKPPPASFKPDIRPMAENKYYKLLVVGESGLGKTTFIQNLFEPYCSVGELKIHDGSSTSLHDFINCPESMCTTVPTLSFQNMDLHVSIQDTPGYGDDMNIVEYLRNIVNHVFLQRKLDYDAQEGAIKSVRSPGILEHSVSVCLYFLPPHRVRRVDMILMTALGEVVPLIPVISKADSMTVSELRTYRENLMEAFGLGVGSPGTDATGKPLPTPSVYRFSEKSLAEVGLEEGSGPPFAVIGSTTIARPLVGGKPQYEPVREYSWGKCAAADPLHSDTVALKRLLMGDKVEDSLWDLLACSIKNYQAFAEKYKAESWLERQVEEACRDTISLLETKESISEKADLRSRVLALEAENKGLRSSMRTLEADLEAWQGRKRALFSIGSTRK